MASRDDQRDRRAADEAAHPDLAGESPLRLTEAGRSAAEVARLLALGQNDLDTDDWSERVAARLN